MARGFAIANAEIWTMQSPSEREESMLVVGDRVVAVGRERTILAKARREGVPVSDAAGRVLWPGLVDAHTHLVHQGLLHRRLDLRNAPSLKAALDAVRRYVTRRPGRDLVLAERWDESRWPEKRYPHRDEIDAISKTVPIVLRRIDGHLAVGNKAACDLIRPHLAGVDPETGILLEEASLNLNQVFPSPLADCVESLAEAQAQALALGVTTVHDFVVPPYVRAYQELHRRRRLRVRAHLSLYVEYLDSVARAGFARGLGDDRLRLHGIKIFGDGSLGGHTAALHEPYADGPEGRGRLNFSTAALRDRISTARRAGLVPSVHAIGDAAIDQAAAALAPAAPLRPRIEHFELHTPEAAALAAERGIVASMQPNFVGEWNRPGGMYEQRLGRRRNRHLNQFRRLASAGVRLAFGSDCMPFDPWYGLAGTVNAPYASQRLTLPTALSAYTRGSAWSIGREADLGFLGPGAKADFLILPRRPTSETIATTRPLSTFVDGFRVHGRPLPRKQR